MLVNFTTTVEAPKEKAFALVADWQHICAWDPNTKKCVKITEGPLGVGTRYELTSLFKGKESPMKYEIVHWEPPTKVVLVGEGESATATDSMTFRDVGDGKCAIDYQADIRLKGFVMSMFTFLIAGDLQGLGKDAKRGMEEAFGKGMHKDLAPLPVAK